MKRPFRLGPESPLRDPQFRLLFAGREISMLGSAIAPIALAFAVLDLSASASALGLVLASMSAPQLVFLLVGGILSDRMPRNVVLVGTSVAQGVAQLLIAVLLFVGEARLWHLVALSAARGVALAFAFPAQQGLVPQTVPRHRLHAANAYLSLTLNATNVGGAALGGILVAATSPAVAIAFDAGTFFASAAVLACIRVPASVDGQPQRLLAALAEGWREFRGRSWLWVTVTQHAVQNAFVFSTFMVLGPVIALRFLDGARSWGFILAAQSVGLVAGGMVAVRYRPQRPLVVAALVFVPYVVLLAALADAAGTAVVMVLAAVAGAGLSISGVLWETTVQSQVPPDRLSRVVSYDALGSFAAVPLGYAIVGPLSSALGLRATFWLAAAILAASLVVQVSPRSVRALRPRGGEALDAGEATAEATA